MSRRHRTINMTESILEEKDLSTTYSNENLYEKYIQ
jgi:hypothetical protein